MSTMRLMNIHYVSDVIMNFHQAFAHEYVVPNGRALAIRLATRASTRSREQWSASVVAAKAGVSTEVFQEEIGEEEINCRKLSQVGRDFVFAALQYGKIIINEKFLPNHKKTIAPVDIGGLAGGQVLKIHRLFAMVVQNSQILMKFSRNFSKFLRRRLKSP